MTGEITRFEEGDAAMRRWVGMGAGSSYFDATVRILEAEASAFTLTIEDNRCGFIPPPAFHSPLVTLHSPLPPHGLTTMRQRVEDLGGTFQLAAELGRGTQVRVELPFDRARRRPE